MGEKVPLEVQQGRAHRRDGGDMGGGLADDVGADGGIAGPAEVHGLGAPDGIGLVLGIALGLQHRQRGQAVERAGIQMGETEMRRQLLGQGALAACRGAVNGDDDAHGASITAPSPAIKSRYSGNEVAIMVTSSTVTGFCAGQVPW